MKNCRYKIFSTIVNPQDLFARFKDGEMPFLLESGRGAADKGRYSFFSCDPFLIFRVVNGVCFQEINGVETILNSPPLVVLGELLERYRLESGKFCGIPLLCGAVGFFAYDFGFLLEKIKRFTAPDPAFSDCVFGFYDWVVCVDHLENKVIVFSSGFPEQGASRIHRARQRLKDTVKRLQKPYAPERAFLKESFCAKQDIVSNFSERDYLKAVETVKEHIARGDIYQVNLSQRLQARLSVDDWMLYRRLSKKMPVSFSGYFKDGEMSVISASPEMFLEYDGRLVLTRPMKGTRPRMTNRELNCRMRRELVDSAKEKAELLMIVDLERNDLGRVCEYGSVEVRNLRKIESYRGVFQAIAEIAGVLHSKKDRMDLIRACFPGGSVTGAPKIAAMKIIERLEPHRRGLYTGSLGFLSFHDTLEFNILIRSFLKYRDDLFFHVGGGIVADSQPLKEYEETLIKAKVLLEALTGA